MSNPPSFTAIAIPNIPLIHSGDDLESILWHALQAAQITLQTGDVLVIASKIVAKAEGRTVALSTVEPTAEALQIADQTQKDPRLVQLILEESQCISRMRKGVIITEHRLGFVSANAGIDASNVDASQANVLLLPSHPDQSANDLYCALQARTGQTVPIIITDTHGRPFRLGNVGVAIGVAGIPALWDQRGDHDLFGRTMQATILAYADLIASAAHLIMGETDEGFPVILVRGLQLPEGKGTAQDLNRPPDQDLYR